MKNKIKNLIFALAIVLAMAAVVGMFPLLHVMAQQFAQDSPQLEYMRVPLTLIFYLSFVLILLGMGIASYLVLRSSSLTIFSEKTVHLLRWIGRCFALSTLVSLAAYAYAFSQLGDEIGLVNLPLFAYSFLLFIVTLVVSFITRLFDQAVQFKIENDMTV